MRVPPSRTRLPACRGRCPPGGYPRDVPQPPGCWLHTTNQPVVVHYRNGLIPAEPLARRCGGDIETSIETRVPYACDGNRRYSLRPTRPHRHCTTVSLGAIWIQNTT